MIRILLITLVIGAGFWGYYWYKGKVAPSVADTHDAVIGEAVAYVAGGCFWCIESDFEKLPGVYAAVSGYMGGEIKNPSYKQVSGGDTGHREAVKVTYDTEKTTYRSMVLYLLKHTDPTDAEGSFYDRGRQYTSAIYYQTEEEQRIAEEVIRELDTLHIFEKPIAATVEPAGTFWVAEDYHQDYAKKNPLQYNYYRKGSGRDDFIESVWGDGAHAYLFSAAEKNTLTSSDWKEYVKPDDATLKRTLTAQQYTVTQKEGTERAFNNEYWDNHEEGIYVDIVSGEPLFSSTDKFDSGTGWPSFLKPLDQDFVVEKQDHKLLLPRTEIRSRYADSHLGHIILDGPVENDKIRYCMNSAALRFVPKENLEKEGLETYLPLFE